MLFLQVLGVVGVCFLLWLRIDWGFKEWIHEVTYYNFWNGVYVLLSGQITACQSAFSHDSRALLSSSQHSARSERDLWHLDTQASFSKGSGSGEICAGCLHGCAKNK